MNVAFEGIGRVAATFAAASGVAEGQVCKISANGTVAACADGDSFIGVAESLRNGYAGVQVKGFCETVYTGTAPSLGYVNLAANGTGGIKTASGGRAILVVSVDTAAKKAVIVL